MGAGCCTGERRTPSSENLKPQAMAGLVVEIMSKHTEKVEVMSVAGKPGSVMSVDPKGFEMETECWSRTGWELVEPECVLRSLCRSAFQS